MSATLAEPRVEVTPRWPFRLPRRGGLDGLTPVRGGVLHRLLHVEGQPVLVRVAQPRPQSVVFGARAEDRSAALAGIDRVRKALDVDRDLREFYERFRFDPLIGPSVRRDPSLRVKGRPDPFEALAWAICEQLIEVERAAAIQRRLVWTLGRRCPRSGLRDSPCAEKLSRQAPARLESLGLSATRALALWRASKEVSAGRIKLDAENLEQGWARLKRIKGIGNWTVQKLGLTGQGRLDQLPALDLAYLKLVGRLKTGNPYERATEHEVEELFSVYAPWSGLAGLHALRAQGMRSSSSTLSHGAVFSAPRS